MAAVRILLAIAGLGLSTAPAHAREFCPDRPGLGSDACTIEAGRFAVELGLADWTIDKAADARIDIVESGQLLVRIGLTDRLEAQVGWTAFGHVRTRDRSSGLVDKASGSGDVTLALQRNLAGPDGDGFSLAVAPFVSLPTGGRAIGDGDWSAGLVIPVSYDLGTGIGLGLTGSVEAAADSDRNGRHLAYGAVAELSVALSDALEAGFEIAVERDEDPQGSGTEWLAAVSAGWMANDDLQFDAGVNVGLRGAPDVQLYFGVAKRF